jgi:hypothetical protein
MSVLMKSTWRKYLGLFVILHLVDDIVYLIIFLLSLFGYSFW